MIPSLNNCENQNKSWYLNLNTPDTILSPFQELFDKHTIQGISTKLVPHSEGESSEQNLMQRLVAAEKDLQKNSSENKDTTEGREILEKSWYFRLIEKIAKIQEYNELKQGALMLCDKAMSNMKDDSPLMGYDEGLFSMSGNMLSQMLAKYTDDADIGKDIKAVKSKFDENNHWIARFGGVSNMKLAHLSDGWAIQDLAIDVKNRVESLKVGEWFLIPIAIQTSSGGELHAMSGKFIRTDDNKYTFTVYNVGTGKAWHPQDVESGAFFPFSCRDLPLNEITSIEDFLIPLIKHATHEQGQGVDEGCDRFYRWLRTKRSKQGIFREGQPKQYQFSRICSWKCQMAALKDSMPVESYKKFVLKMKIDFWWGLFQKYGNSQDQNSKTIKTAKAEIHAAEQTIPKAIKKLAAMQKKPLDEVKAAFLTEEQQKQMKMLS